MAVSPDAWTELEIWHCLACNRLNPKPRQCRGASCLFATDQTREHRFRLATDPRYAPITPAALASSPLSPPRPRPTPLTEPRPVGFPTFQEIGSCRVSIPRHVGARGARTVVAHSLARVLQELIHHGTWDSYLRWTLFARVVLGNPSRSGRSSLHQLRSRTLDRALLIHSMVPLDIWHMVQHEATTGPPGALNVPGNRMPTRTRSTPPVRPPFA